MTSSAETDQLFGAEHVRRYRETDGETGHEWRGATILLLTTTGHKSGNPFTTPLIYRPHGDAFVIVASKGGNDEDPVWYTNLTADPAVKVQVFGDEFDARARTATAEEKPELWKDMVSIWPAYDDYQRNTDRV
jgi:deazaflavin-dependent oxidoreductase (nitroreductase family)